MNSVGNLDKFYKATLANFSRAINVSQYCKVVNLHSENKHADIQPLALTKSGEKRPMILEAIVVKHIRKDIKENDVVIVVFIDRNTDNFDGSNKQYYLADERSHSINDACVMGII